MAKKPNITTIASGYYSRLKLNENFENLRNGFDNTLSLDGSTPNAMQADLDFNNKNAINIASLDAQTITLGGSTTDLSDIQALTGISQDIQTLANIEDGTEDTDAIQTAASVSSEISVVSGVSSDVTTVAAIDTDVSTVAGVSSDVSTVASNISDVTNFADVYLGPAASDPATRNDGSPLQEGDLYFNTNTNLLFVYNGSDFQTSPTPFSTFATTLIDDETAQEARQTLGLKGGATTEFFDDVSALLADTGSYAEGTIIRTRKEGFAYEVATSGASDHHVTTAGGVKLYVLSDKNGFHNMEAWGVVFDADRSSASANDTALTNMADKIPNGSKIFIPHTNERPHAFFSTTITWTQLSLHFEGVSAGAVGNRDPDVNTNSGGMFASALVYIGTGKGFVHQNPSGTSYPMADLNLVRWRLQTEAADWAFETNANQLNTDEFLVVCEASGAKGFWNRGGFSTYAKGLKAYIGESATGVRSAGSIGVKISLLRSDSDSSQLAGQYFLPEGASVRGFEQGIVFGNDDYTDDVRMENIMFRGEVGACQHGVTLQRGVRSAILENGYYEANKNSDIRIVKGASGVAVRRNVLLDSQLNVASIQVGQSGSSGTTNYFKDITIEDNYWRELGASVKAIRVVSTEPEANASGVKIRGGAFTDCDTSAVGIEGSDADKIELIEDFAATGITAYSFFGGEPARVVRSANVWRNANVETTTTQVTLDLHSSPYQIITPDGAATTVQLPSASEAEGKAFVIQNASPTYDVFLRDDSFATLEILETDHTVIALSDGLEFQVFPIVAYRATAVAKPSGGSTVDTEARGAINTIINRLKALGLTD